VGENGAGGGSMFRGATKVTLDAKGRLAVPSRYREGLLTRAEGHLVVTVEDQCLLIYSLPDWEEIERKLVRLPALNDQARDLQRRMVGYASDVDMDGHGRILLTRELREYAALDRQAMLVGVGIKFELWSEERWNAKRDTWRAGGGTKPANLPPELETLSY